MVRSIYLCDDDEDDREFFRQALCEIDSNAALFTYTNGEELVSQLSLGKNKFPEIIFLDLNMPRKDGIETLHDIRSHIRFQNVPIIIFTTSSNRENINSTYCLGANRYVVKPTDFNMLKILLKNLLTESISSAESIEDYLIISN